MISWLTGRLKLYLAVAGAMAVIGLGGYAKGRLDADRSREIRDLNKTIEANKLTIKKKEELIQGYLADLQEYQHDEAILEAEINDLKKVVEESGTGDTGVWDDAINSRMRRFFSKTSPSTN